MEPVGVPVVHIEQRWRAGESTGRTGAILSPRARPRHRDRRAAGTASPRGRSRWRWRRWEDLRT